MSWTDRKAIEHIKQIRDIFKIDTFVETGTYKGLNVMAHLDNFKYIYSCEKNEEFLIIAFKKIEKDGRQMPFLINQKSEDFLKDFKQTYKNTGSNDIIFIYLDAHFYDPKAKNKWIVLDELKALKGFRNCVICIHDFDNNLGHITYDKQPLNLKLIRKGLLKVNQNFKFYTNELSSCDIVKIEEVTDEDAKDNLKYAWSMPEKTYRGILYAVPKKIKVNGLRIIE